MKNYIQNPTQKVVITFDKNTTLACIYEDNKVVAKGTAVCCSEDEFDIKAGSELALTRALEAMKPKMPEQEWVVVKREPRPGDYVRLRKAEFSFNRDGDVMHVYDISNGIVEVKAMDHLNRNKSCMSNGEEYIWNYFIKNVEVVEPVIAAHDWVKVDRPPRIGDYIRIIKVDNKFDDVGDILKVGELGKDHSTWVRVNISNHPKCKKYIDKVLNGWWLYNDWLYQDHLFEVVEPAPKKTEKHEEPKYRKITRTPKKGDYVRVLTSLYSFDKPDCYLEIDTVSVDCDGNLIGFSVSSKKHPLAIESNYNSTIGWHYNMGMNKAEFYEKV